MDFYKSDIPVVDLDGPVDNDVLNPAGVGKGYVPRDYSEFPESFMASAAEMDTYDPSEWDALYDEQEEKKSSLEHIYLRGGVPAFTNLDQGKEGDCWAYSTAHAKMLADLRDFGYTPRLNPHFIAAYLRRYDGGWCGASAKVFADVGCCVVGSNPGEWPKWSHNTSAINSTHLDEAAKNKTTEEWRDLTRQVWDQSMTSRQLATCGFMNVPCPSDFNWWGHSVCQVRWVRIEKGSWGPLILNSWLNWGRHGLAVLRGSKAVANGAVGIRY